MNNSIRRDSTRQPQLNKHPTEPPFPRGPAPAWLQEWLFWWLVHVPARGFPPFTPDETAVLLVITHVVAHCHGQDKWCHISDAALAESAHVSVESAKLAIRTLHGIGAIHVVPNFSSPGRKMWPLWSLREIGP